MKTLTEFSGTLLRDAARIRKTHRDAIPPRPPKVPAEAAAVAAATEEGGASAEAAASAEPPVVEVDPAVEAADAAARAEVESAMGIKEDRLARLFEALDSVKDRVDNVRLIRVMQGDN